MLKKANRLAKAKDIFITFARGRAFFNPFFTIKYLFGPKGVKLSVVVSNKVFKKANQRNRLKRIIREWVRKNLIGFKPGNYLIVAKPKVAALPEEKRFAAFLDVINRMKR